MENKEKQQKSMKIRCCVATLELLFFREGKTIVFLPDTLCPSTAEQKQKASDAMDQQHVTCLTSPVPDSQQFWSHFIF